MTVKLTVYPQLKQEENIMKKIVLLASTIFLTVVMFLTSISSVSAAQIRQNLSIIMDVRDSIKRDLVFDALEIQEVIINNDNISINVSYGGGCKIHDFTLIGESRFVETLPVQGDIILSHNSNGDRCEMLRLDTLIFDLIPLKETYLEGFSTNDGDNKNNSIILRLVSGDQIFDSIEYQIK